MADDDQPRASPNRHLLVSKAWIQWAALVVLFGFFVLGFLAYRTYAAGPPIPAVVIAEDGAVVFSYLAAGIFLAPLISGHEPRNQHLLAYVLLGALAIVVVGSLGGELSGIHGWTTSMWLGNQGFEYLDLGRLWQVLLSVGLFGWVAILFRGLRRRLSGEHMGNMPWLFFFAALAIPAFYAVGLLAHPNANFTVTDFWRFWVVHLWVEDFLELFTTITVAYFFVLLGAVEEKTALRLIYLDVILYSAGGVIGSMHHVYFSGEPVEHMALGAVFSAAEVIPLTFLTLEAWTFLRIGQASKANGDRPFPHRWAMMFLIAVTVTGTSAEAGDDGEVGRGNRASGLITPYRVMTLEAVAGKNPVSHVGKLYNLAAARIASAITTELRGIEDVACVIVSQIGRPVDDPYLVDVGLVTDVDSISLELVVTDIVRAQLGRLDALREELLSERLPVY